MTTQSSQGSKKQNRRNRNIIETFEDDKRTLDAFEQLFGERNLEKTQNQEVKPRQKRQEFTIFNRVEYQEKEQTEAQIKDLLNQIKNEVEAIKKADSGLISKIQEAEKIAIESSTEKHDIYNIKFLEIIVSYLRSVRMKIGESSTWFEALKTKKKKRGSLFANLSKKKGTQYSLSQELQSARSVQ